MFLAAKTLRVSGRISRGGYGLKVVVLSVHADMGTTFIQTVCSEVEGGAGHALVDGAPMDFSVMAGAPHEDPAWQTKVQQADVLVLLVRFLDAISLDKLKAIRSGIASLSPRPMAVFLFREEGEIDFKMSCPSCGQKLWVRDTDENKKGRCPNCKQGFRLPSQAAQVKMDLSLPDSVPITRIMRGNMSSCRNALVNLKGHLTGGLVASEQPFDPSILMKSTVRIELSDSDVRNPPKS